VTDALGAALRLIEVGPGCRTATVGRREVSATGPEALRPELADAIYRELHAGWTGPDTPVARTPRDRAIEERFRELMPHGSTVRTASVLDTRPGEVLVRLDGVRVWVPSDWVETEAHVRVPADWPALSSGYFLVESAKPWTPSGTVLRIYVHLTSVAAAFDAWSAMLLMLADTGIGYRAKVASSPGTLPRRDALVLYLSEDHDGMPRRVARAMARVRGIGTQVSVFARPVAPGVAMAWEPVDRRPGMNGMSFGEHRAAVLADALVRHASEPSGPSVADVVREAFIEARIDPADPARNLPY
jgi:hypothetical protein